MVEDFWSEIVKSDIHLKLLKNIEENSEKKENDKITGSSAITLSRMLEKNIIDDIVKEDGLNIMKKALKASNNKVLNEGLFQFYKEIVKIEP